MQARTVLPALQASVVVNIVNAAVKNWTEVLAVSIGSLKVKTTALEVETPLARFAGTVERMVGWARAVREAKITSAATIRDALSVCCEAREFIRCNHFGFHSLVRSLGAERLRQKIGGLDACLIKWRYYSFG